MLMDCLTRVFMDVVIVIDFLLNTLTDNLFGVWGMDPQKSPLPKAGYTWMRDDDNYYDSDYDDTWWLLRGDEWHLSC